MILVVSVTPDRGHEIAEFFCGVVDGERFSCDREHDVDVFGGEMDTEGLLEDGVTLISVLSSIIYEVTRDRGHDVDVFGGEMVAEELLEDGVTLI